MEEGESYSVALKWKKHSNYFLHLKQLNNMALYMRLKVVSARIKNQRAKGRLQSCGSASYRDFVSESERITLYRE